MSKYAEELLAEQKQEVFFDDHPKIKNYANALKKTARDLNTMVNNVLAGGSS